MMRAAGCILPALLLVAASSPSPVDAVAAPVAVVAQISVPGEGAFGYAIGEMRRYVLGPPDALVEGESAEWTISLHHIEGEGADRRAVFDLDYLRREPYGPLRQPRVTRSVWGEVTVNDAGFPLRVAIGERVESGEVTTTYAYAAGRYQRTVLWPEREWSIDLRIPGHGEDDELEGVHVFMSQVPEDIRRRGGNRPFRDNVLSNPGLLVLMWPQPLPEEGWKRDTVIFSPGALLVRYPTTEWFRVQRNGQVLRGFFDRNSVSLGGVEEVEIGGETMTARRFEIEGPFRGGYVDLSGRVLMIKHDPGRGMSRPQHIRLLRPDE